VAAYLGDGVWIDADPRRGFVSKFRLTERAANDSFFFGKVRIVRWDKAASATWHLTQVADTFFTSNFVNDYRLVDDFADLPRTGSSRTPSRRRSIDDEIAGVIGRAVGVIAFHEKAGRSQVDWVLVVSHFVFPAESATDAILLSASRSDFDSLGASWAFSFQLALPPDSRPLFTSTMEVGQAINAVIPRTSALGSPF
jgi:hypothetical protein